ncbi:MAG TPA: hypothetical protein VKB34_10590 [Povalibacter sp.]|nr:hypothetical protein [Povalibacter sp.]
MKLPARSNLDHLKKQAKDLLRSYRAGDPAAARLRTCTRSATPALHDAQHCVAREYGFASWTDLKCYVEVQNAASDDREARVLRWLQHVYAGDVTGRPDRARPLIAQRILAEHPDLAMDETWFACAIGDDTSLRRTISADPASVHRVSGPLKLPPLVAVTHSGLMRLAEFRSSLHRCARVLLDAGADPNQRIANRWPPASLESPDESEPLSSLYGAAGQNHDPELTGMLLAAGADPNDGESLYHSLESPECTRLLLEAGARIPGSNAMFRVFDLNQLRSLQVLLAHGADPNEVPRNRPLTDFGSPLLWAIRRCSSRAHIEALLAAGADPSARTPEGISAHGLALRFGLIEIADLLRDAAQEIPLEEQFLGACARADEQEARRIQSLRPDLPGSLAPRDLRMLPDLVSTGSDAAARIMVKLGWPIAARGGDIDGSALNLAVFRGEPGLTEFLLRHGASWQERHAYADNVIGSLSWASRNRPNEAGDWVGCAEALLAHGMPAATRDAQDPEWLIIDGGRKKFADDVAALLTGEPL